jgi:23S rRNA (adenine2030-N6)-methyltransferase
MNYRHDFHAGNFADVLKHVILARILRHLAVKPSAFRYIETHAGGGLYDLGGAAAERTGEWRRGIGRLRRVAFPPEAQALIEPYLRMVRPLLDGAEPRYPGSPLIAQAVLRPCDRMIFCERHPETAARLGSSLGKDLRAKVLAMDGYAGLKALVPPVERRGLVLIDPPFEQADEFARLGEAVGAAWRKWATGTFMIWYPVKDPRDSDTFARAIVQRDIKRVLRLEMQVGAARPDGPLARAGLIVINPPYRLDADARPILACLCQSLAQGKTGFIVENLVGE